MDFRPTYWGTWDASGNYAYRPGSTPLRQRNDLRDYQPHGFAWGYDGNGARQLALAILADRLQNDERALRLHEAFAQQVIAKLVGIQWELTPEQVDHTVQDLERSVQ